MSLHVMAEKMAFFLVRKNIVGADKAEIYSFGMEILLATIINAALVLTVSLILGIFWQTLLMLAPFMLLRCNAGGFHAKTHTGCMLGFLTVYTAGVVAVGSVTLELARALMFFALPFATSITFIIGSLPHKNRPVSSRELILFKRRSHLLSVGLLIIGCVGLYFFPEWFIYFSLGTVIAASSLLAGRIQNKLEGRRGK